MQGGSQSDYQGTGENDYARVSELGYDYSEDEGHSAVGAEGSDYHAKQGESSRLKVTFNYVNTIVGAGIVGLPYAMKEAGIVLGVMLMILMVCLSKYSVVLLVKTGVVENVRNYEELMERLFGFYGYMSVMILIFLFDFGVIVTYLIILGDVSSEVVREIAYNYFDLNDSRREWVDDAWNLRRATISSICVVVIFPLCLFRDISKLERFAMISVGASASVVLVCLIAAIFQDNCPAGPSSCPDDSKPWFTLVGDNPAAAFGIIAFTFISNDSSFFLFSTLDRPSIKRWSRVTRDSLLTALALCLLTAIPGYISFREKVDEDLLNNYSKDDKKILVVRVLFVFSMALSYPIGLFICRHIINDLLYRYQKRGQTRIAGTPSGPAIQLISLPRYLTITFSLCFSSLIGALFVNRPGVAMSLTGNVCAIAIAFILPPACSIRSQLNRSETNLRLNEPLRGLSRSQEDISMGNGIESFIDDSSESSTPSFIAEKSSSFWGPSFLLIFGVITLVFCTIQTFLAL